VVPGDIVYEDGRIRGYRQHYFPVYNADRSDPALGAPLLRETPTSTPFPCSRSVSAGCCSGSLASMAANWTGSSWSGSGPSQHFLSVAEGWIARVPDVGAGSTLFLFAAPTHRSSR
jgi:hypothetical protein